MPGLFSKGAELIGGGTVGELEQVEDELGARNVAIGGGILFRFRLPPGLADAILSSLGTTMRGAILLSHRSM